MIRKRRNQKEIYHLQNYHLQTYKFQQRKVDTRISLAISWAHYHAIFCQDTGWNTLVYSYDGNWLVGTVNGVTGRQQMKGTVKAFL